MHKLQYIISCSWLILSKAEGRVKLNTYVFTTEVTPSKKKKKKKSTLLLNELKIAFASDMVLMTLFFCITHSISIYFRQMTLETTMTEMKEYVDRYTLHILNHQTSNNPPPLPVRNSVTEV